MIATLFRLLLAVAGVYGFFLTACPKWSGDAYHVVSLAFMIGGAVMLTFFFSLVEIGSRVLRVGLELAFVCAIALYLGWTFPQMSGRPPIKEWMEGQVPRRADAREGLKRLGIDTGSAPAKALVKVFPK